MKSIVGYTAGKAKNPAYDVSA